MSNGVRYTPTFAMPSEYERQAIEARRRRRMAEMLAAQAYQPQEGGVAPIPTAAPLVQGLQAFLTARQLRKAEEAEQKASETESEYAKRISGRLAGGYVPDFNVPAAEVPEQTELGEVTLTSQKRPAETLQQYQDRMRSAQFTNPSYDQMLARTPEQTTLEPIVPTARYKKSPEEALAMAETDVGMAAMKNRPVLAARLAKLLEEPKAAEYGTNVEYDEKGNAYVINKRTGQKQYTGAKKPTEAAKPVTRTGSEDLGDRVRTYFSDGTFKDTSKGVAPTVEKKEKPLKMPGGERLRVVDEMQKRDSFDSGLKQTQFFKNLISSKKLPLSITSAVEYKFNRAMDPEGTSAPPGETPAYVNYYKMLRFVDEQVNTIMQNAKGTQTEGDALRARQQILDNPNNEAVVMSALGDLERAFTDARNRAQTAIDYLEEPYRENESEGNW